MSQSNIDYLAREKFQERISKGMIGPGSDTWGLPDEEEIISNDTPLQRYFSGILFPDKDQCNTQTNLDDAEIQSQSESDDETDEQQIEKNEEFSESTSQSPNQSETDKISKTSFFHTNIGLSISVPKEINKLNVTFSFGLYYQPKNKEIKIKIAEAGYKSFFDENIPYQLPFKDILKYEDGFMLLERELKGNTGGKKKRSEEYLAFDEFKKKNTNLKDSSAKYYIDYLEKLISQGRIWKRKNNKTTLSLTTKETLEPVQIELDQIFHKNTKVGYNVKVIEQNDKKFVKIQLVNLSEKHPANRFSNKNEKLNLTSLFQGEIQVNSTDLIPYKNTNYRQIEFEDDEAKELDFIYRSVENYAIGHNCSTIWNDKHNEVKTTFSPVQNVKDITNTFGKDDKKLNDALDMHNLSAWGFNKAQTIEHLDYFIDKYGNWIKNQAELNKQEQESNKIIGNKIIERQNENLQRLKYNILLKDFESTQKEVEKLKQDVNAAHSKIRSTK